MTQQINLYRFLAKPIQSRLTIKVLLLLCGLFFLLLMAHYMHGLKHKKLQIAKLNELNIELSGARQHLIDLAEKYPQLHLQSQFTNLSKACRAIFSGYLTDLGSVSVPGVWLTEINITANGTQISLRGNALKANQVQEYLSQLNQQTSFSGLSFVLQELNEASKDEKTNTSVLSFSLITEAPSAHT